MVNPHRDDCPYPFAGICGGVVAYKLVQVLYEQNRIPEQEWKDMLEFAAIATVGDVMKLRTKTASSCAGVKRSGTQPVPDCAPWWKPAGLDICNLTAYHIGFVIGPCLNASGRLKTAQLALELLLCEAGTPAALRAEEMVAELKLLNEERKDMTQAGMEQAFEQVDTELAD